MELTYFMDIPPTACVGHFLLFHNLRIAHHGPYRFWKVLEIENGIFQDFESFVKERILKVAMEKFWNFVWKNSKKYPTIDVAYFYSNHCICFVCSFYYL